MDTDGPHKAVTDRCMLGTCHADKLVDREALKRDHLKTANQYLFFLGNVASENG